VHEGGNGQLLVFCLVGQVEVADRERFLPPGLEEIDREKRIARKLNFRRNLRSMPVRGLNH